MNVKDAKVRKTRQTLVEDLKLLRSYLSAVKAGDCEIEYAMPILRKCIRRLAKVENQTKGQKS
jgi:hypothetical protein